MDTFLAIDLGASNGRVMIGRLAHGRLRLQQAHRFEHNIIEQGGRKVWDWSRIRSAVRDGLHAACELAGDGPIAGVSCSAWAQDFGLLDRQGELFYPPVCYRDERTAGMPHSFAHLLAPLELRGRTGSALLPVTTLCQLRAMALHEPDALRHAATMLHIPDLIHCDLCADQATDWTLATASQLRHLRRGGWDKELLAVLGIPSHFLPKSVIGQPAVLGQVTPERAPHPRLAGTPVVAGGGHDTAAATAAVVPMHPGTAFLSLGTWAMLGCCVDDPSVLRTVTDESVSVLGIAFERWALFHGGMGLWMIQQCRERWLREGRSLSFAEIADAARAAEIRSIVPANDPRFHAPADMVDEIRQACCESGQREPCTPGEVATVVFDSLARGFGESLAVLSEVSGLAVSRLHIVGGGTRNAYLCQRIREELTVPVQIGPAEATAMGNCLIQAWALGRIRGEAQLRDIVQASC